MAFFVKIHEKQLSYCNIGHRCLNLLAPCDHGVKVDGYREGEWGSGGLRFRKDLSAEGAGKKLRKSRIFGFFRRENAP